ncbi:metallophosphoesterase [Cupriavidus pauculus]|uniref:Metallophosphoesterase n=1 Tax=Cupriavidus pauculus TaxID=82633 RepID=A0A5P2H989_9BURK|nr:metallophosphoesterase [Cupriavidus pauculus]QET03889.1 metallophosphoesterase [Cupriavidus pauculus]
MRPRRAILFSALTPILLHSYIGFRLVPDLPGPMAIKVAFAIFLAISALLVPAGMRARRYEPPWADRISWIGMLAMGLFSSLLVLTFLRDIFLLVSLLAGWHTPALLETSAVVPPVLALVVSAIGFFNARGVAKVVEVDVPVAGLPAALQGFTIAQISDIHVGPTIKGPYIDRIVDRVNGLDADAVAITGDLVDGSVRDLSRHTAPLGRLASRHGTFVVTGNHEYYAGAEAWIDELRRIGLRVLLNEHVVVERDGASLVLGGVTDFTAGQFIPSHRSDPVQALTGAPADAAVRVLLAHQPRSAPAAAAAGFDLQLSGHTHGGQFWPWNLFVPMQQPYVHGLRRHERMWIYVSRGTGYWGPPKRFGAPSEITRVRLVAAK